jgi:putative ABC transport system permease protein
VANDVRHNRVENSPDPCLFLPQAQRPAGWAPLLVRTADDPAGVVAAVKQQLHVVAPHQGIEQVQTMERVMSDSLARPRLDAAIFAMFGGIALLLASVGIFAVISCSVEQRTLATLLYAIPPTDALVYGGVSLALAASALAGCYFPARHATRVDPATVLREE